MDSFTVATTLAFITFLYEKHFLTRGYRGQWRYPLYFWLIIFLVKGLYFYTVVLPHSMKGVSL